MAYDPLLQQPTRALSRQQIIALIIATGAPPTGPAGGDLSGTYPNPTVARINTELLGPTTPTSGNLLIADGTQWNSFGMSGDSTISSAGILTLATVNANVGVFGDATNVGQFTVNAKGLITAAANVPISFTGSLVPAVFFPEDDGDSMGMGMLPGPPGTPGPQGTIGPPGPPSLDSGDSDGEIGSLLLGLPTGLANCTTAPELLCLGGRVGQTNDPILSTTANGNIYGSTTTLGALILNASTSTTFDASVGVNLCGNLALATGPISLVSIDPEFTFRATVEGCRIGGEADSVVPSIWFMDAAVPLVDNIAGFNFAPEIRGEEGIAQTISVVNGFQHATFYTQGSTGGSALTVTALRSIHDVPFIGISQIDSYVSYLTEPIFGLGGVSGAVTSLTGYGFAPVNISLYTFDTVIGVDLSPGITAITNAISLRSTVASYSMLHTGNVRIGDQTTPAQALEVLGNILIDNTGTAGELRFAEPSGSGTDYSAFKAQAQVASLTYTWPALIVPGGVLRTDASGLLDWAGAESLSGESGIPGFDGEDGLDSFIPGPIGARGPSGDRGAPGLDADCCDFDPGMLAAFGNDHHSLANLNAFDDHARYFQLAGRSGGQTAFGGTATTESLTLGAYSPAFAWANTGRISLTERLLFDTSTTNSTSGVTSIFTAQGTYTIGQTSAAITGYQWKPTISTSALGTSVTYPAFYANQTCQQTATFTHGNTVLFASFFTDGLITANGTSITPTTRQYHGYVSDLQTSVTAGTSLTITNMSSFASCAVNSAVIANHIGASTTVTNFRHFWAENLRNAGTVTNQYGLDMDATTVGGTGGTIACVRSAIAAQTVNPISYFLLDTGGAQSSLAGKFTTYNNVATVTTGLAPIVALIHLTAQSAAIAAGTALYAVPAAGAGLYRVSWVAAITTAATTSSILGGAVGFQLTYTDPADSVVKTSNPTTTTAMTSAANTTATSVSGTFNAFCKASTNLQYGFGYTSVGGTVMVFDLEVRVEWLG